MAEIALNTNLPIVDENGIPTPVMRAWMTLVTRLAPITGDGSPQDVVAAPEHRFYWDETGNTLYFKESAAVSDDPKKGWVAV